MRNILLLLLSSLLSLEYFNYINCYNLIEDFNKFNDDECLSYLQDESFTISTLPDLMSISLNRGLWKCAKDITRIASQDNIDIKSIFDLNTRTIQKEISLLKSAIESNLPMNTINPAFQWAQSVSDVFLNIKFAHKLDAPATLNVEAQNVSLNTQSLTLRASDGRKLFALDLEL